MTVGILGLGLIGGSLARAYALAGHTVYATDRDESILAFAQLAGAVDAPLTSENMGQCDLVLLAIYPEGAAAWLEENAPYVSKNALVMDCCGVKQRICDRCFPIAEKFGFTFMGGHPMAGTQFSGFKHSRADLFAGAPMVLVPHRFDDMDLLDRAKMFLSPCGFGSFTVTTAAAHKGFSAGSYKDLTRVAWLNPGMWAGLFLENKEFVLNELDTLLASLSAYRDAVAAEDRDTLTALLEEGKRRKETVDG